MKNNGYGMGNFNKDIDKMIEDLVAKANESLAIQDLIEEATDSCYEDDAFTAIVRYIAYYYDVM